mgnify:CR=1 FL=1
MSNGLRVNIIGYENVARDFEKELEKVDDNHILFIAEQLRFSDEQVKFPLYLCYADSFCKMVASAHLFSLLISNCENVYDLSICQYPDFDLQDYDIWL